MVERSGKRDLSITGAAFWALMDSWRISDDAALRLIGGPPLTSTGKRPRFRLVGEQVEKFELLRQVDRQLVDIYGQPFTWLHSVPVFSGHAALEHMILAWPIRHPRCAPPAAGCAMRAAA